MTARSNWIIGFYIHQDQAGFINSWQLRVYIRRICNIINYAQDNKVPILLYFANAEKAFDGVEWVYLKKVLIKMSFCPYFLSWIQLIYSNQVAESFLEGYKSWTLSFKRGLSGISFVTLIFNIIFQILAIAMPVDPNIHGIQISSTAYKLALYADGSSNKKGIIC